MKHKLKAEYYIRYADDFVIFCDDKKWLENQIVKISEFLTRKLKLELHPDKVSIETFSSGVDFLGMVNFPDHRILRTKTKRRMFKKILIKHKMWREELVSEESFKQSLQSYLGTLKHCQGYAIKKSLMRTVS